MRGFMMYIGEDFSMYAGENFSLAIILKLTKEACVKRKHKCLSLLQGDVLH